MESGDAMAEIADHGLNLDLRTRRGADFALTLVLRDAPVGEGGVLIDVTGSIAVTRIFAPGQADVNFGYAVSGPAGTITISLNAAQTMNMQQTWAYVVGYKNAAGATRALLFGSFFVSQDRI